MSVPWCGHASAPPTALSAFEAIVDDEDISDVTLQGTDGLTVQAVRAILAARSHVFRRMFFGHFSEATSSTVSLPYRGAVLRSVVDFCYCDKTNILDNVEDDEKARLMVGLAAAAHYFELPGLQRIVQDRICVDMCVGSDRSRLACAVLDEALAVGPTTEYLVNVALCVIRMNPEAALLPANSELRGVLELNPPALSKVMADGEMRTSELVMFRALKKWVEGGSDGKEPEASDVKEVGGQKVDEVCDRNSLGMDLVSNIDLTHIATSELRSTVAESGLVTPAQLSTAFETQALLWEKGEDVKKMFSQERCQDAENRYYFVITGAGVEVTNGVYLYESLKGGVYNFTKKGMWEERERVITFSVKRNDAANMLKMKISILPEKSRESDINFYFAAMPNKIDEPVPKASQIDWQLATNGSSPTPIMFYIARD